MKLAFNSWVYSSFPVWVPAYPLIDVIERLAKIGYDGIEIGAASPHAFPDDLGPERRRENKVALDANGSALASMPPAPGGGPGFNAASPSPEECRATTEQYNKVVDLCADLGGRTVLYVAGWQVFGTSRQQAWAWSREALIEIAAHASNRGVTLATEPTLAGSNLIDSCDDAMTLMAEVDEPNVKLMFDTCHVIYRNEVSTDYIRRMGKDLHRIHLADANRSAPSDAGQADYRGIVQEFRNLEFQGYVTMEIGFDRRSVGGDRIAREALEYIRPLVS